MHVINNSNFFYAADGFLWEEGPNSFQPNSAILRLIKDLGLLDELIFADPKLPRFVFWKERLYALPSALKDIFFFNLLSCRSKYFNCITQSYGSFNAA